MTGVSSALVIPGAVALGWRPQQDLSLDEWLAIAEPVKRADDAVRSFYWAVGDWLVYGEDRFGGEWVQVQGVLGKTLSMGTLEQVMHVARHVTPEMRRADLPFWHHREVVPLIPKDGSDPKVAGELLEQAADEKWPRKRLRGAVRQERDHGPAVLWANPPWDGRESRRPKAAADSVLLMWADPERLADSTGLMTSWGYAIKGVALGERPVDRDHGWVRSRHRFLLVGARGQVEEPKELLRSPLGMQDEVESWAARCWPGSQGEAEW